jgi:hypothetical protein
VFALGLLFSLPTQRPSEISQVAEFSSTAATQNACYTFYENNRKYFNTALFQIYKAKITRQGEISNEEIQASLKIPEHFLAIIEVLSVQENYEGFNFEARIKDLSPRQLKKLQSTLTRYTKEDSLSKLKFANLLVAIYRIAHQPKGIVRNLYETRDLKEALDRLDDSAIQQRIEASLFNETMEQTFSTIISDPTRTQKFVKTLKDNAPWLDLALFTALWGSTIVSKVSMGIDIDLSPNGIYELMPPYVPGVGLLLKTTLTKDDLSTARTRGLRQAIEDAKDRLKSTLKKTHRFEFGRWVYSSLFTGFFIFSVMDYTIHKEEREQAEITTTVQQSIKKMYDNSIAEKAKTYEERGEDNFQDYLKYLDQQGTKYDINSPEIQAIRTERIATAKRVMEAMKKQNPN